MPRPCIRSTTRSRRPGRNAADPDDPRRTSAGAHRCGPRLAFTVVEREGSRVRIRCGAHRCFAKAGVTPLTTTYEVEKP